jgi:hypothetical protein
MLAFRSAINAASVDYIPTDAVIFTYAAISNSSWTFWNTGAGRVVKSSVLASAATGAGSGTWTTTSVTDTSTDSIHTGTLVGPAHNLYTTGGTTTSTVTGSFSNGAHTHTWTGLNLTNSLPPYYTVGAYTPAVSTLTLLPINTIIFSAANPNTSLWTAAATVNAALENKSPLLPTLASSITATGGALTNTPTLTSSTAAAHGHSGSMTNLTSAGSTTAFRYNNLGANGSHSHTSTALTVTMSQQYIKLGSFINTTTAAPLVSGMIIAYKNTSTIPTNWFLCNGQTVRGVTTPDLVTTGRYVRFTSTSHGNTPTSDSLTDSNIWSGSATLGPYSISHTHSTSSAVSSNNNRLDFYHSSFAWSHNHPVSVNAAYEPPSINLAFIMYIP